MENLKIEKMSNIFINDVFDLEKQLIGDCSIDSIKNSLSSDVLKYFVLLKENEFIGFMECSIISPEAELFDIAIKKEYQGKGYSKFLMNYLLEYCKSKNCDTIYLEVNKINYKAINLYKKFGFVEYSERKKYYGDNDAVLMKLQNF